MGWFLNPKPVALVIRMFSARSIYLAADQVVVIIQSFNLMGGDAYFFILLQQGVYIAVDVIAVMGSMIVGVSAAIVKVFVGGGGNTFRRTSVLNSL